MEFPSKYISEAVEAMASLPGIGKKTALRMVLHLLRQPAEHSEQLAEALVAMRQRIRFCTHCHNIADDEECLICTDLRRDRTQLCVVQDYQDVLAIENTRAFSGLYHVLGGVISPMNGVGPEDLHLADLAPRCRQLGTTEVVLALSATMEADTTAFYLSRQLEPLGISISSIARGVPLGGELEYTDELTLGRSLQKRQPYQAD